MAPPPPTTGGPNIPDWMRGAEPGSPADRERQRREAEWQARQPQPPPTPAAPPPPPPPPPQPPPQQMTATRLGQQFAEQERRRQEAESLEKARQVEVSGAGKMPAAEAGAGEAAAGAEAAGAAGGPVGLAVAGIVIAGAAIKDAFEKAIPQVGKFGEAVVRLDAEKVARGFGDLAGKIPLFGTAIQNATHAVLDVSSAANQEGRRLAMYSGQLAATYAGIDVRNIQRDIQRAQQNADLYAAHATAREDFNEKIYEVLQALEPQLLVGLTNLVNIATQGAELAKNGFNSVVELVARVVASWGQADLANELRNNWRVTLNLQREEARRRRAETVNPFLDQLLAMRRPQAAISAEAQRQQDLRRDRRGPTFQGFGNL